MMIRKIIADDVKSALIRAKYEFGSGIVIVSQKEIKVGKWFNPFKKKKIEITFGIDDKPVLKEIEPETESPLAKTDNSIRQEKEIKDDRNIKYEKRIEKEIKEETEIEEQEKEDELLNIDPLFKDAGNTIKNKLSNYCKLHNKEDVSLNEEERRDFLKIVLKESPFEGKSDLSKISVLVGPTGVGKTTTIAKIAANQKLSGNKKVGLITIDSYRIGAIEQLKIYANILSIPFYAVNNSEEMKNSIEKLKDCDIILIDTLGSSPKDMGKLIEIKKNINSIGEDISTYLVMSMSTDKDSMDSIIKRYKILKYDAMVLTKVDEVENMKNLWYLIDKNLVPIQYFCHGQDVPDDIKEATPENIFKYFEENLIYDRSS